MLAKHRDQVAAEWAAPGQHLEKDDSHRVEIRARIDTFADGLLGRHVRGRPHERSVPGQDARGRPCISLAVDLGKAEVEHLPVVRIAVAIDEHDVLGLQIAMDDTHRVRSG
jgi:hypothetical protein